MSVKIRDSIRDPAYIKKLVDKRLKDSLEIMANDVYQEAKRREPPKQVKDTIANRIRRLVNGNI